MSIIEIIQYPDPRLALVAKPVDVFDDDVKKVIDDMFDTHYAQENCAALANSQMAFKKPQRITVIDFSENKDEPLCLVNPEIIDHKGETYTEEGCMSVPGGIISKVKRAEIITVKALDKMGKPIQFEADGFLAKCIQHELDHLNGVLFIDHVSQLKRQKIDKRLLKLHKQGRL